MKDSQLTLLLVAAGAAIVAWQYFGNTKSPASESGLTSGTNADAVNQAIQDMRGQKQLNPTVNQKGHLTYPDQFSEQEQTKLAVADIMAQNPTNLINATDVPAAHGTMGANLAAATNRNVLVSVNPNLEVAQQAAAYSRTGNAPAGTVVQTTSTSKAIATGQAGVVHWVKA